MNLISQKILFFINYTLLLTLKCNNSYFDRLIIPYFYKLTYNLFHSDKSFFFIYLNNFIASNYNKLGTYAGNFLFLYFLKEQFYF